MAVLSLAPPEDLIAKLTKVYIHKDSWNSDLAQRILNIFPAQKIHKVETHPQKEHRGELSAQEFSTSKRLLYLEPFRGQFFKRCPGARPGLTCCNYFVLNWGQQCNLNCSYCYLQSFINSPVTTLYTNLDQALDELKKIGQDLKGQKLRIGTGELVDSLSLEPLTHYAARCVDFFKDYPQWNLELKSKAAYVDNLLNLQHGGNVTVSWSINPQAVIESEEWETASLSERLNAAKKCRQAGYQIGFHIDPMIWHPEWKENYAQLVDSVIQSFSPQDGPYLSVGGLRFQPEQRHIMRQRFGMKSWAVQAEMFPSSDGKLRYDQRLRSEMFKFVIERFKNHNSKWNIFLCMEAPETWLNAQKDLPQKMSGLKDIFDHRLIKKVNERIL